LNPYFDPLLFSSTVFTKLLAKIKTGSVGL